MSRRQGKRMTSNLIVKVTKAKTRLHNLVNTEGFAANRRAKVVGIYLSKSCIEALSTSFNICLRRNKVGSRVAQVSVCN